MEFDPCDFKWEQCFPMSIRVGRSQQCYLSPSNQKTSFLWRPLPARVFFHWVEMTCPQICWWQRWWNLRALPGLSSNEYMVYCNCIIFCLSIHISCWRIYVNSNLKSDICVFLLVKSIKILGGVNPFCIFYNMCCFLYCLGTICGEIPKFHGSIPMFLQWLKCGPRGLHGAMSAVLCQDWPSVAVPRSF